jgi:polysaccharide biosynthesis/export protein
MIMTVQKLQAFCLVLICSIVLAGCPSGGGLNGSGANSGAFAPTGKQGVGGAAAANAQKIFAANSQTASAAGEDYKIAPLDVLEITVLNVPDISRTVQVSTSGKISMPLIKTVQAGGRTSNQLEQDLARKLEAGYLQSPQVSVFVKEYNSQRITVDGAVMKPGIFPITGKVSLLQSIALAEGLNTVADPTGILLFRTVDNKRLAARYDLKLIRSGKIDDPQLQAGDIVMVDESSARTTMRDIKDALPLTGLFQLLLL